MRGFRTIVLFFAGIALAACAAADAARPPVAEGPVPAGMAHVTVTRSGDLLYVGAPASVDINGERFTDLAVGETRSGAIRPGRTVVTVSAWSAPGRYTLRFEAVAGARYRLFVSPRAAQMTAGMVGGLIGQAIEGGGPFQVVAESSAQIR